MSGADKKNTLGMGRHLSMLAVWGLSFGYAVGWGAFVMPGATFLPDAGPLGTVIGVLVGAFAMAVIGWNEYTHRCCFSDGRLVRVETWAYPHSPEDVFAQ